MNRRTKIIGAAVAMAAVVVIGATQLAEDDDTSDGDTGEPGRRGEPGVLTATDLAYDFETIEVSNGGTITFRNEDDTTHTLTADDGLFDSGPVEPGESWTTSYDGPRMIDVHCDIHPRMRATIVVGEPTE